MNYNQLVDWQHKAVMANGHQHSHLMQAYDPMMSGQATTGYVPPPLIADQLMAMADQIAALKQQVADLCEAVLGRVRTDRPAPEHNPFREFPMDRRRVGG